MGWLMFSFMEMIAALNWVTSPSFIVMTNKGSALPSQL